MRRSSPLPPSSPSRALLCSAGILYLQHVSGAPCVSRESPCALVATEQHNTDLVAALPWVLCSRPPRTGRTRPRHCSAQC